MSTPDQGHGPAGQNAEVPGAPETETPVEEARKADESTEAAEAPGGLAQPEVAEAERRTVTVDIDEVMEFFRSLQGLQGIFVVNQFNGPANGVPAAAMPEQELPEEDDRSRRRWWMGVGIAAFLGILLGILVQYILNPAAPPLLDHQHHYLITLSYGDAIWVRVGTVIATGLAVTGLWALISLLIARGRRGRR
jgi:hypothetical protein